jgi:chemotaxis protein MotB
MARKRRKEEHQNHERWLVSYADLITLMFAFFVVMYSLSSVNEGKYRILAASLEAAFRGPTKSLQPIQQGDIARSPVEAPAGLRTSPAVLDLAFIFEAMKKQDYYEKLRKKIKKIAGQLEKAMAPLIDEGKVSVRRNDLWIEVEIKDSVLFPSGSAKLANEADSVLQSVAEVIRQHPNRVQVEGFTDNVPINNYTYPSNWELSASRAGTVVRLLSQYGVESSRMVAMGYAEHRPKASNSTAKGRRKNRRVVVTVLADMNSEDSAMPAGITENLLQRLSPLVNERKQAQLDEKLLQGPN